MPLLFLVLTWFGLITDFSATRPALWFSLSGVTIAVCSGFHFIGGKKAYPVEFLFSFLLLSAGLIRLAPVPWLILLYFPLIVSSAALFEPATTITIALLVPLLRLRTLFSPGQFTGEVIFAVCLVLTAAVATFFYGRVKRQRQQAVSSLDAIKDNARNIALETGIESLGSEEIASHYFASVLKTDEEIGELLQTIKAAVFADSANLFIPEGTGFSLRCSTEDKDGLLITDTGIVASCFKTRKPIFAGGESEKGIETGYIRNGKVSSVIAVPLLDGPAATGVLTVDSARYHAFSDTEKNTVAMFVNHLVRVLERERVYLMIKREIFSLKILREESSSLVSSLNADVIASKLCEGAGRIAPARLFFFISEGKKFRLSYHSAAVEGEETLFDLGGTFLNMAVENHQTLYMSDVTNYRVPIMPFKGGAAGSVLVIPMLYENKLLGLFVMLAERKAFLDTFQVDMLKVMCNQATTSIANARLHHEIEKMATTDGLTGLFNHRVFQERLSVELKRLNRFSGPVSLILTDIDHFKRVNDLYGHPAGDVVLKGVAKTITEEIRDIDIAARYGGEEFAVVLPGTDGKGAAQIAERLRKAIMENSFPAEGKSLKVTISLGIATVPIDAKSKEELIEKADKALYHAKHNGRNRSVQWSEIK